MHRALLLILTASLLIRSLPAASETIPMAALPQGARLALCGDSITEQMLYTRYVEAYLLACAGRSDISVFQFGWGGENADQFRNRITRGDLAAFKPTVVSVLYGANDAAGMAWQDWMEGMWRGRITGIIDALGTAYPEAQVLLCSPTVFDAHGVETLERSDASLERFRVMDIAMARQHGIAYADVRWRMQTTVQGVKAALGTDYRMSGRDGVHPGPNGHLCIAHEVLRALGCDGAIATISMDMAGGAPTASSGHVVVSSSPGRVELDSARYPFCTGYDGSDAADRMAAILPWLPFNQDLNRFVLTVSGLQTAAADVTWGGETRRFSRAALAAGINLAAAFPHTPFDAAFAGLMERIGLRQQQERTMIKAAREAIASTVGWTAADVVLRDRLDRDVHAGLVPVRHVIRVVPAVDAAP
jgi:lysophospholipase L1-like esterase